MGGIGSGTGIRPNRKRLKQFIEAFPYIDTSAFPFSSMRLLPKGCQLSIQGVRLQIYPDKLLILQMNSSEALLYEIFFSLTPAHYGNHRYWLQCPKCKHRRRKLSLIQMNDGFPLFLCRCCLKLAYQSQNRTQGDQLIHKKWQLLQRLDPEHLGIIKPKGMHWHTFHKIHNNIKTIEEELLFSAPFNRTSSKNCMFH